MQVLTPEQAALAFIESFPWYPDMLAVADLVSRKRDVRNPAPLQDTPQRPPSPARGHLARRPVSEDSAAFTVGPATPGRANTSGRMQLKMGSMCMGPRIGESRQARSDVASPLTPELMSHLSQLPATPNSTGSPISKPNSAEIARFPPPAGDASLLGGGAFPGRAETGGAGLEDYLRKSESLPQTTSTGSGSMVRMPSLLDQVASAFRQRQSMEAAPSEGQTPRGPVFGEGETALVGHRATTPLRDVASAFGSVVNGPSLQTPTSHAQAAPLEGATRQSHKEWVRQQVSRAQRVSVTLAQTLADLEAQGTRDEGQGRFPHRQASDDSLELARHDSISPKRSAPARLLNHRRSGSMGLMEVEAAKAVLEDMRDLRRLRSASLETELLRDFMERIQDSQQDIFPGPGAGAGAGAGIEPKGNQHPPELLRWMDMHDSHLQVPTAPSRQASSDMMSRQPNLLKPVQFPLFDLPKGPAGAAESSRPASNGHPPLRQLFETPKRRVSIGEYSFQDDMLGPSPRSPYFAGGGPRPPFAGGPQGRRLSLDIAQQLGATHLREDPGETPRGFADAPSASGNRALGNLRGLLSWGPMLQAANQELAGSPSDMSLPATSSPPGSRSSGRSSPTSPKVNRALVDGVKGMFKGPDPSGLASRLRPPMPLHTCNSSPPTSLSGVDLWFHGDGEKAELLRPMHSEELYAQEGSRIRSQTTSPSPHALLHCPTSLSQQPSHPPPMAHGMGKPVSALSHALHAHDNGAQDWKSDQAPPVYMGAPPGQPPPHFNPAMQGNLLRVPTHPIGTLQTLTAAGFLARRPPNRPTGNGNN